MAKHRKDKANDLAAGDKGGWVTNFLADEQSFDKRALWRLGSWGMAAVAAVTIAVLANKSYMHTQRDQIAAADLERQSGRIQRYAREAEVENKRLSSAIQTLNSDRDRLYARVSTLEQGLDSVTGSIARQAKEPPTSTAPNTASDKSTSRPPADSSAAITPPADTLTPPADTLAARKLPAISSEPEKTPVPTVAAAASTDAAETPPAQIAPVIAASPPMTATPSILAPPDPAATKLIAPDARPQTEQPAASEPKQALASTEPVAEVPVQRTEFGVDLGGANSVEGLRALWRRVGASNTELAGLRPLISVQEGHPGAKLHLRLLAGPFDDAAAAAKICAAMATRRQACATSVFDGQRLSLNAEPPPVSHVIHRRVHPRTVKREPAKPAAPPAPSPPAPAR
jgi:hypothetical protein